MDASGCVWVHVSEGPVPWCACVLHAWVVLVAVLLLRLWVHGPTARCICMSGCTCVKVYATQSMRMRHKGLGADQRCKILNI